MTYLGFNNLLLRKPHRIFIQIIAENGNCHQSLSSSGGARILLEDGDTAISLTGDRESDPGVNLSHSKLRGSSNPRQYADGCMVRTHRTNQTRSWSTPIILGAGCYRCYPNVASTDVEACNAHAPFHETHIAKPLAEKRGEEREIPIYRRRKIIRKAEKDRGT